MSKKNKENINQENNEKKPIIKKIIKIALIIFIGIIIVIVFPFIYFILEILYSMFIDVPSVPKEKHGEFPFELVYEYRGEQITIKDTIVCDYEGRSWSLDGGSSRDWKCKFEKDEKIRNSKTECYTDLIDYISELKKEYTEVEKWALVKI